jgi:hypothetical protein
MKRVYTCPHCQGILNPGTKVVLRGQLGGKRALILLSPQPGNYDVTVAESFGLKPKDRVDFSCPLCDHDLGSPRQLAMAEVALRLSSGATGTVAFSKIFGQHATYFITEESVRTWGEHAQADDVNFFGAGPED